MYDKLDSLTREYVSRHGLDCALGAPRKWQYFRVALILAAAVFLLFYRWDIFLCAATAFSCIFYGGTIAFRTVAMLLSLSGKGEVRISADEAAEIKDEDLPVYTVLLPLYREEAIVKKLLNNLDNLDYPKDKLDIKLLLEKDDNLTRNILEKEKLPPHYELIVVPDNQPKTKPRACNYGLAAAKGEFCVIFDAEDRPEPDQLRKVVNAFRKNSEKLACIQAKLNYYNHDQNLLTKLFTIEYSTTFDLFLPGLKRMRVPVPLGGTSNHFRTGVLREIGGWAPFNVTEDCDLGVKIYKSGHITSMINSTTWEEANSQAWNWVRQRSRWVKGFIQTHFVHTANPLLTLKHLGLWGYFGFYQSVGASSLMLLLNPFFWVAGLLYLYLLIQGMSSGAAFTDLLIGPHSPMFKEMTAVSELGNLSVWPMIYIGADQSVFYSHLSIAFFVVSVVLLAANLLFILTHYIACYKRGFKKLAKYSLLMPFYWIMISFGAWKGFVQLLYKPYYWEKTIHGITDAENIKCQKENINVDFKRPSYAKAKSKHD
jgi:cellulose synthase/poly-beta-1,6-N-acetylglucosamine synthase-like glycosyltransferase